jgi:hypothetical protein
MMIMTMTVANKELSSFMAIHTSETMKSPSSNATAICFGQISIANYIYIWNASILGIYCRILFSCSDLLFISL